MGVSSLVSLAFAAGVLTAPATAAAAARIEFRGVNYTPSRVVIVAGESVTWVPTGGESFATHPLTPALDESLARSALYGAQCSVCGASRIRSTRAGTPPTTASAGTSFVTTVLVPITALSPTVTPRRKQAP